MKLPTHSREVTHLSPELVGKLVSADDLEKSLPAGSKKRLAQYRRDLTVSRGLEKPLFDDRILPIILKYAYDPKEVMRQVEYLNNLKDPEGHKFSRDFRMYSMIEKAANGFSLPDHPSFRWNRNYQLALKWLRHQLKDVKLKPLKFECDDDIRNALPKEDTHSGFMWLISGHKKKGDNLEGLHKQYTAAISEGMRTGTLNRPVLIGFRTQGSGEYEDDGTQTHTCKHKTRMVQMYDLISVVNELQFSIPFQEAMARKQFYAGGKDSYEISSILSNNRTRFKYYFSIDYSNFDATISSWLIEDAFQIIKETFILNDEMSRRFDIMVHDFIHKEIVLNEGILKAHRAVPSGSMWTQLIDSIVNAIAIITYFIAIGEKAEMMTMGDDNIIFTNAITTLETISSYIRKNFGLDIKIDDKSAVGRTNDPKGVKFLSRFWRWDGQYRHPYLLLSRMLFPERFRSYNDEVKPELVVYAFILTYNLGMAELMNCQRFMNDLGPISRKEVLRKVDSRYLPGSLAFILEYTRRKDLGTVG